MVNANDFTYSKGYLGLLSALGASLGITFCCAPSTRIIYDHCRQAYSQRKKMAAPRAHTERGDLVFISGQAPVDIEDSVTNSSTLRETLLPMTDNNAAKAHGGSARFSVDSWLGVDDCDDSNSPSDRKVRRNHTLSDVPDQIIPRCRVSSRYMLFPRQSSSQIDGLGIQHGDSEVTAHSLIAEKEAQRCSEGVVWSKSVIQRPGLVKWKLSR